MKRTFFFLNIHWYLLVTMELIFAVPHLYPIDEELIKLSMVDQLGRLGLSEHFSEEIEDVLRRVYK